jgi:GrpB-like predicted nucleotidyltransferase (UPF0157 family)
MSMAEQSTAHVVVTAYDPRWPGEFERSASEIVAALGPNLLSVHHIGSTAVPGLDAKPVIDLLAVVAELAALDEQRATMEQLGYEVLGEFGIAGRRYFRRDDAAGRRTHQIHAFVEESPHIARHIAFRDFLLAHPEQAHAYGELKRRLAVAHPHDIGAYMDGKDAFIKEMEARALAWAICDGFPPST